MFLQWGSRLAVISRSAVGQTLSVNQLVDMEWRFGVTASSNEAQRVGSSFLQLRLLINKGNTNEEVFMGGWGSLCHSRTRPPAGSCCATSIICLCPAELTLPQFYSFLHEMEKAKASLEFLS